MVNFNMPPLNGNSKVRWLFFFFKEIVENLLGTHFVKIFL